MYERHKQLLKAAKMCRYTIWYDVPGCPFAAILLPYGCIVDKIFARYIKPKGVQPYCKKLHRLLEIS